MKMLLNISFERQDKEYKRCIVKDGKKEVHSFVTSYQAYSFEVRATPEPHFPNLHTVFYVLPGEGQQVSTFGYSAWPPRGTQLQEWRKRFQSVMLCARTATEGTVQ
jgi:hypothetical protein